jgi:dolichol-phosphate mannosyltransferase
MLKLTLVVPAYNEADGVHITAGKLRPVMAKLRQHYDLEVIFVNDGSRDETGRLLKEHFASESGVRIISHEVNRGLGGALRTGFAHANGDIIFTTDFDGTYSFETIEIMLNKMLAAGGDVITASPYHPLGRVLGVPKYRLMFSFGAALMYRLLVNWRVHCWTSLFRAYRAPVIRSVPFQSNDFLAVTELLVGAAQAGYKIIEFPATLRVRTFGQSSMKIARVTIAHLKYQRQILLTRLGLGRRAPAAPVSSSTRR